MSGDPELWNYRTGAEANAAALRTVREHPCTLAPASHRAGAVLSEPRNTNTNTSASIKPDLEEGALRHPQKGLLKARCIFIITCTCNHSVLETTAQQNFRHRARCYQDQEGKKTKQKTNMACPLSDSMILTVTVLFAGESGKGKAISSSSAGAAHYFISERCALFQLTLQQEGLRSPPSRVLRQTSSVVRDGAEPRPDEARHKEGLSGGL